MFALILMICNFNGTPACGPLKLSAPFESREACENVGKAAIKNDGGKDLVNIDSQQKERDGTKYLPGGVSWFVCLQR